MVEHFGNNMLTPNDCAKIGDVDEAINQIMKKHMETSVKNYKDNIKAEKYNSIKQKLE